MTATHNTELRKLRPGEIYNLALILNLSDNWKKLMASVTREDARDAPKFSSESMIVVEQAARQERKLAASIFLEEWSTMGRKRPTVGLLLDLLMKTELFRAADYVAQDILKIAAPKRPDYGPAAAVDVEEISNLLRRHNLQSESDSHDSNFQLRSTADVRLSQIDYPSRVFDKSTDDNNSAVGNSEVGFIEMRYAESTSNQILGPATIHPQSFDRSRSPIPKNDDSTKFNNDVSDLMKFTTSHVENSKKHDRSDLLKFDSEKSISSRSNDSREAYIPDLNVLRHDSTAATNAEMESTELPACLGNFVVTKKSSENIDDKDNSYYHRELISSELPVCINFPKIVDSSDKNFNSTKNDYSYENSSNNLSESFDNEFTSERSMIDENVNSMDQMREINEKSDISNNRLEKNSLNSGELPLTVLEFHKR